MKRVNLEHIIRAAGSIANSSELIIIGSQSILGSYPAPPAELTVSQEADLYPTDNPAKADLVDGTIGEKSPFHDTFGYYAHGVGPETAILPKNWKTRLVRVQNPNTNNIAGLRISPADLAVSKLAAGREKDLQLVSALFRYHLVEPPQIESVLEELDSPNIQIIKQRLARCTRDSRS